MSQTNSTTTEIRFDRLTRDYSLYLDGEYVGSAPTHSDGERILNELRYHQMRQANSAVEYLMRLTGASRELAQAARCDCCGEC